MQFVLTPVEHTPSVSVARTSGMGGSTGRKPTNHDPDDLPRLITADELAAILGLSKRSVWRLVANGEIPEPLRVGGSTRWPLDEIEAWLDAGCPPCVDE